MTISYDDGLGGPWVRVKPGEWHNDSYDWSQKHHLYLYRMKGTTNGLHYYVYEPKHEMTRWQDFDTMVAKAINVAKTRGHELLPTFKFELDQFGEIPLGTVPIKLGQLAIMTMKLSGDLLLHQENSHNPMTINANLIHSYDVSAREILQEMIFSAKANLIVEKQTLDGFDLVIGSSVSNKTFTLGIKIQGNTVSGQLSTGNIRIAAKHGWIMEGHMEIEVSGSLVDDDHSPPPVVAEAPSVFSVSNGTHLFAVDQGTAAQLAMGGTLLTVLSIIAICAL